MFAIYYTVVFRVKHEIPQRRLISADKLKKNNKTTSLIETTVWISISTYISEIKK